MEHLNVAEACIKLETIALCVDMLPMSWEPLAALQVMKGAAQVMMMSYHYD